MRIIKFVVNFFLMIFVLVLFSFFISREVFLYWGFSSLKQSVAHLRESQRIGNLAGDCLMRGAVNDADSEIFILNLRFVSPTDYVLEAVCSGYQFDPIELEQRSLPNFVSKLPGDTGFINRPNTIQGLTLTVFTEEINWLQSVFGRDLSWLGRQQPVIFDGSKVSRGTVNNEFDDGPVTTCQGYGYFCCDPNTQLGTGDQQFELLDCEANCFAVCGKRPVLLSFTSNPFFEPFSRTVSISNGEMVEFAYVADRIENDEIRARVSIDDGQTYDFDDTKGRFTHVFDCSRSFCTYQVMIELSNRQDVKSIPTNISTIQVEVNSQ